MSETNRKNLTIPGALMGAIISVVCAVFLATLIILFTSSDPGFTLRAFFTGPWKSSWFLGNTLDSIALLLTASLGIALAFRGGCFNLGGEGQIYLGGLAASVVLLKASPQNTPPTLAAFGILALAALAAILIGSAMGGLSGILKRRFGANELITSFLISSALSPVADYIISGPFRNPEGSLMATRRFTVLLPRIMPPSNLSLSFIFALALVCLGRIFLYHTVWGYRYKISGSAPDFARYGGINPERCIVPAMTVSGALNGLTGFFAVAGTYGLCHLGFPGGLGWNAVAVSLIARNRPLALIPAALIFGWLKAGSDAALLSRGLSFETTSFIQAVVLILATIRFTAPIILKPRKLPRKAPDTSGRNEA
ncbi:branched-chain amino acid ABC transporter, permease protein [Treponema primitia ZAS-2]|uniref:Branched-chain amino acid ABC transporter, permease protein n=1 Tax=Treponema primitia (strain ATCC BAA-887 / DSM 12427 / ZAS-2) TaxID=545694 RepID=F5YLL1_TREPZ|nr:ABC transporter permease [Treponema primitia]AEF84289.1 branched-chain amino acid ABC transporter, permease protein [Treponema primitia ZAS-2]